jgi:tRNA pseudouridine55 synthase
MTAVSASATSVHGVLLLDKDPGISSNSALQQAKRLLGARKAGHTGSLDPLASGLLPLCLGEATKLAGFLLDTDKRYRVSVHLGLSTDSGDAEGKIIEQRPVPDLDIATIEAVLRRFRGPIVQVPPMYSALKHHGHRLYELARRGIEVDRDGRPVEIFALDLLGFDGCRLDLDVHCSKGTYIRSLAIDLGVAFGCGAHVDYLRRMAVGQLSVVGAHRLASLQQLDLPSRRALLEPMEVLVPSLPVLDIGDEWCWALQHGQRVHLPHAPAGGLVRLQHRRHGFIGIGAILDAGWVAPRRLLQVSSSGSPTVHQGISSPEPTHL